MEGKEGKSTPAGRKHLASLTEESFTWALLNPVMHEEFLFVFFLIDHQGSNGTANRHSLGSQDISSAILWANEP